MGVISVSVRSLLIPSLLICAVGAPLVCYCEQEPDENASRYTQEANVAGGLPPVTGPQELGRADAVVGSPPHHGSRNLSALTAAQHQSRMPINHAESSPAFTQLASHGNPATVGAELTSRSVPFGLISYPQPTEASSDWGSLAANGFQPDLSVPQPATQPATQPTTQPEVTPPVQPNQIQNYSFDAVGPPNVINFSQAMKPAANSLPPGQLQHNNPVASEQSSETSLANLTPDYLSAQTWVLPGDEHGPDFNAQPLEFLPVTDFNQIFRFDVSPDWVVQRWPRVASYVAADGLTGLRVALVTGTSSWDLHGSLTYLFDSQRQLQRITYRGWTGDPTRLLQMLTTQFGFSARQTKLAGFYVVQNRRNTLSALLMKNADVIRADRPTERLGIVMEINNPQGASVLSEDFQALIRGAQ